MFETTSDFVWQKIQPRPRDAHKGTFGSVLVVAGSASYRGAAALAVEGACAPGPASLRWQVWSRCWRLWPPPARVLPLPLRSGRRGRHLAPEYRPHPAAEGLCPAGGPRAGLYGPERRPVPPRPGRW